VVNLPTILALAAAAGERGSIRFLEFFAANRNPQKSWPYDSDHQRGHQTEGIPVSVEKAETEAISSAEPEVRIHLPPAKSLTRT
jgi:hypothetical protein